MIPAKRFNEHLVREHGAHLFRCEECYSFLDKDDLLFHMNRHAFDRLPQHTITDYYRTELANLAEQARISQLAEIECQNIREMNCKLEIERQQKLAVKTKDETEEKYRAKECNETPIKQREEEMRTPKECQKTEGQTNSANEREKVEIQKLGVKKTEIEADSTKEKLSKGESDEVKSDGRTDSDVDRSPLKRKRKKVVPKRVSEAELSPAKRLKRNKRSCVSKSEQQEINFEDCDDGNDGDDEVNTPKASPSIKENKMKEKQGGSDKSPKTSRTCPICGKQYRASSSYFYHMKYFHKRSREHECPVCKKKFGTKANLTQHASIHSGAYDLECKECGKRFKSKPSLYIHEQSHGGPKRWACAQCGRSFRWRTHLARHVTRHEDERAHVCTTCGRGFSVRCDLLRHARTHVAVEFHCATCGLKFAQKRYLQVHVVKKHRQASSQVVTRS